jgi:hypothetical protein
MPRSRCLRTAAFLKLIKGGRYGFKVFQDEEILTAIEGTTPEHQLHEFLEYHFPRRQPATLEKN